MIFRLTAELNQFNFVVLYNLFVREVEFITVHSDMKPWFWFIHVRTEHRYWNIFTELQVCLLALNRNRVCQDPEKPRLRSVSLQKLIFCDKVSKLSMLKNLWSSSLTAAWFNVSNESNTCRMGELHVPWGICIQSKLCLDFRGQSWHLLLINEVMLAYYQMSTSPSITAPPPHSSVLASGFQKLILC